MSETTEAGTDGKIVNDAKGTVMHDQLLHIETYYASGRKGASMLERDGKVLERGYYARTADGWVPYGPARTRNEALSQAYDWRERLVRNAKRSTRSQPVQAVEAPEPAKKAPAKKAAPKKAKEKA